ncbi:hypothetical protein P7M50_25260 [Vibrio parahaemolyticus]|nr:hypothetical protein [Vibrio parahaemolyticus]
MGQNALLHGKTLFVIPTADPDRAPGMEPTMKTNTYERGTYYFFDCLNWRKVAKEFHLEYDKLEERPHLPSTVNYNPAQQAFSKDSLVLGYA